MGRGLAYSLAGGGRNGSEEVSFDQRPEESESRRKTIQAKGTVLALKDTYQEFKCYANDSSVGFWKMKIGISLENYGSFIHSLQV